MLLLLLLLLSSSLLLSSGLPAMRILHVFGVRHVFDVGDVRGGEVGWGGWK